MIPRYSRPEMVAIWEPQTRFRIWFEIEAHACDAQADLGVAVGLPSRAIAHSRVFTVTAMKGGVGTASITVGGITVGALIACNALGDVLDPDTAQVIAAMVDMQGRLIGKRFHAQFFVDGGWEETHGCNYLLGVDIEMEPVPGYKATSWEKGYGDFVLKPDMATLRRVPWLTATALVLCDILDHHTHEDVPHSPRAILKKQLKRLEQMKLKAYMASANAFLGELSKGAA